MIDSEFIDTCIKEAADSGRGPFVLKASGYQVIGQDISRRFLPYSEWRGCQIRSTNLSMTQMTCASFDDAELLVCQLDGAVLREATGFRATLTQCSIIHAELLRATFYAAKISSCMFDGANLNGANLELARISDSTFGQVKMEETGEMICSDLRGVKLREAEITNCIFDYASFAGADLRRATFKGCSLYRTSFVGANTEGTQFLDSGQDSPHVHHTIWDRK